jgi:SH3-like domain-containing protein
MAVLVLAMLALFAGGASAAEKGDVIPRFATLRSDLVNLRTGPGQRYPVAWVYRRKGLPIEIIAQYEEWRQVRDSQGTTGWVNQQLVTAIRNVVVKDAQRILRADADPASAPVAKLDPGVIAHLLECRGAWCRIETQNTNPVVRGWLGRAEIWGVYPDEVIR